MSGDRILGNALGSKTGCEGCSADVAISHAGKRGAGNQRLRRLPEAIEVSSSGA